ncbi:MAG: UDP-2,4-diacetamido-2,4,6-trideoxy-beta-L-altropyranose hydrolase [Deltaproteobacteria bacterium]|nr:UDP-2,4-diacetamido-2,4,6-trideoxy-beta-L-altropyranose hydrolase [Deltaproteobacteria bacterium]
MNINKSEIIIRADAATQIGSGHIMRCLTLAEKLKEDGANVEFICREHKGNLINFINQKGFTVHRLLQPANLPPDASEYHQWLGATQTEDAESVISVLNKKNKAIDWLIIDHYAIDYQWQQKLRPYTKKIMAIDDLANRKHDCDLLLDQNFYLEKDRYKNLVPKHCIQALGPKFALLRKEFAEARKNLRKRTGEIKRILIFFGGSDNTNQTKKAISAIKLLNRPDIKVDVILGALNPNKEEIYKATKNSPNIFCYQNINNMAEFMAKADLAIGAGGSTTWERCCMGLPAIVLTISADQKKLSEDMFNQNYSYFQSKAEKISEQKLTDLINSMLSDSKKFETLICKNIELVDGMGSKKVTAIINRVEVKH